MIKKIDGDLCHDILLKNTVGKLSFKDDCNYNEWREQVKEKLLTLDYVKDQMREWKENKK